MATGYRQRGLGRLRRFGVLTRVAESLHHTPVREVGIRVELQPLSGVGHGVGMLPEH